jgi:4-amino-4-deoxy-L-arabinose transferase-like glycosyltransferase
MTLVKRSPAHAGGSSIWSLAALSSLFLVFELGATAFGPYGYYIDEPYYLACARRLAWGYVDHPPLSPLVLAVTTALLGHSTLAIRLPAALAGAATAFVTGRMARFLGGGRSAELIAAACLLVGPGYLIVFGFFSMNAFEVLAWACAEYLLLLALAAETSTERTRRLVLLGGLLGVAALNKHTSVLFAAALGLGLLLSPSRGVLRSKGPWLAAGLMLLVLLPNLIWEVRHGFISLQFYRSAGAKNVDTPVLLGIANQALFINPVVVPIGVLGLWFFLRSEAGARYRTLGLAFLLLLGSLLALHSSRPDRIAGTYPALFAAGAVVFENLTRARRLWLRPAFAGLLLVAAGALLPLALPVLPPPVAARYAQALGVVPRIEREAASMPEWLAERLGWPELVATIADATRELGPEERRHAVVLAATYDIAAAAELFGTGLPVVCPHNSYYSWAGEELEHEPSVVVAVGIPEALLARHFRSLRRAGGRRCEICLGDSPDVAIFIGRDPVTPLADWFGELRRMR